MNKIIKPPFYSAITKTGVIPELGKAVYFLETGNFWIFRSPKIKYMISKVPLNDDNMITETTLATEFINYFSQLNATKELELYYLNEEKESFSINKIVNENSKHIIFKGEWLAKRYQMNNFMGKLSLNKEHLQSIADYLSHYHKNSNPAPKDLVYHEYLSSFYDNLIFQTKKYLDETVNTTTLDTISYPIHNFLEEHKLFFNKKNSTRLKKSHGNFTPGNIFITPQGIITLPKYLNSLKDIYQDTLYDLCDLLVELEKNNFNQEHNLLIQLYLGKNFDKYHHFINFYKILKCLQKALSIKEKLLQESQQKILLEDAKLYYKIALDLSFKLSEE